MIYTRYLNGWGEGLSEFRYFYVNFDEISSNYAPKIIAPPCCLCPLHSALCTEKSKRNARELAKGALKSASEGLLEFLIFLSNAYSEDLTLLFTVHVEVNSFSSYPISILSTDS